MQPADHSLTRAPGQLGKGSWHSEGHISGETTQNPADKGGAAPGSRGSGFYGRPSMMSCAWLNPERPDKGRWSTSSHNTVLQNTQLPEGGCADTIRVFCRVRSSVSDCAGGLARGQVTQPNPVAQTP
ncbi:hypothetical protein CDAR_66851 [Caerostris darwini]|uniref:Uncharacterized protein n=1 Tax=Caerostris darwini TaxID=1538125 RepID=A0AAV4MLT4_9ARAC|nr:hypothetical protein CDAR_66851 [Caerostris darwini]